MNVEQIPSLLRPNIAALIPYSCARNDFKGVADVYIDANENWTQYVGQPGRNRYPDPLATGVRNAVGTVVGVDPESVVIGNGSDELIDNLIRMFCIPGVDSIVTMPPTYGAYRVFADINDVPVEKCPLTAGFEIDFEGLGTLLSSKQPHGGQRKLLFLCSPNNPTGNAFSLQQVQRVCAMFDGITVVDEAYFDFSPYDSAVTLLDEFPNLVVLRTLSKSWGLANARIGIMVSSQPVVSAMRNIKYPYNVGGPSQEAALAALSQAQEVARGAQDIVSRRDELADALAQVPCVRKVHHSDANFLLVEVTDAKAVYHYLAEEKIIVRDRSKELHCENCLRITVGSVEENRRLLAALYGYCSMMQGQLEK